MSLEVREAGPDDLETILALTGVQLTSNRVRIRAHAFYERLGYEASHVGMKKQL